MLGYQQDQPISVIKSTNYTKFNYPFFIEFIGIKDCRYFVVYVFGFRLSHLAKRLNTIVDKKIYIRNNANKINI